MPTPHAAPLQVRRALSKLGDDIYDARKRRKLSATVVAERAFTSRKTLARIEKGDPGVSMGIYASVLNALGLLRELENLADASRDEVGIMLTSEALKRRNREPK